MKNNITPGPWRYVARGENIGQIETTTGGPLGTSLLVIQATREAVEEFPANAAAISAVPEMIDALEHALADLKALGGRVLKVEAALAKAKSIK